MMNNLAATFLVSLIGSWHCAGMCGPFGIFMRRAPHKGLSLISYHLGRLITYLSLATALYFIQWPLQKIFGPPAFIALMLAWVVLFLLEYKPPFKAPSWMIGINKRIQPQNHAIVGPLILGLSTTLLPCLWLYGFLILASGQSRLADVLAVIVVFWLGTIPALIASHVFIWKLNNKAGLYMKKAGVIFILILGILSFSTHKGTLGAHDSCLLHSMHAGHHM